MHGGDNWFLALNEHCGLTVFENRIFGGIFGPKKEGENRRVDKTEKQELHNLFLTSSFTGFIKWTEDEIGRPRGTHGRGEKSRQFWRETIKRRNLLIDVSIDGRRHIE